jgi:hypothetical protein
MQFALNYQVPKIDYDIFQPSHSHVINLCSCDRLDLSPMNDVHNMNWPIGGTENDFISLLFLVKGDEADKIFPLSPSL